MSFLLLGRLSGERSQRPYRADRRGEEVKVLLDGKSAVVYGACGAVGAAVAKAFAAEGARAA